MKRTFLLIVLLLALLVFAASCGENDTTESTDTKTDETPFSTVADSTALAVTAEETTAEVTTEADTTYEDIEYDLSPVEGKVGDPLTVHWNPYRLSPLFSQSDDLKKGAEAMIKAILNRRLTVQFDSLGVMEAVCSNLFYEFPPAALCSYSQDSEALIVRISYSLTREAHLEAVAAFGRRVESLIAQTLVYGDGEAEKALLLYHAVATEIHYVTKDYAPWQTNAYWGLIGGESICYGFADAYNYLLRQVGMEAYLVKGCRASDKAPHGWSLVKIDGRYYHCDPTWESSMYEGAGFWYFGNTDGQREKILALSIATVGEGSLKAPIPYRAEDGRFDALNRGSITNANWTVDKQKQIIRFKNKEYSYATA